MTTFPLCVILKTGTEKSLDPLCIKGFEALCAIMAVAKGRQENRPPGASRCQREASPLTRGFHGCFFPKTLV